MTEPGKGPAPRRLPRRSPSRPSAATQSLAQQSPIPLYYQIAKVLQARIFSGIYPAGSQIATEEELAGTFGVSRITVRNAIAVLREQGLIERRRPRGTFVAQSIPSRGVAQLHGFLEDIVLLGDFGRTLWAEADQVQASDEVAERLGVEPGLVVSRVRRVRSVGSTVAPHAWIVNYLPVDIGAQLDPARLKTDSLIQLLNEMPSLQLTDGYENISAQPADEETAERLQLPAGSPLLLVERLLQSASGRVVDFARFYQRGDRVSYSVRLTRIWR